MLALRLAGFGVLGALGSPPSVEIAPGVFMPFVNHGSGNQTFWVELGGRGMDTAWCYDTDNQASIGSAVRALPHVGRSELFITSKIPCCPSDYYSYGTQECARAGVDLNSTEKEIEANLKQIGVEYVDLLLMHWPCSKIEDTVAVYQAMELALGKGQTRAIGVSNFNASALEALKQKTTIKPAVTQNQYSIGNHFNSYAGNDDETLEFCKKEGITVCAWAPLGHDSGTGSNIFNNSVVLAVAEKHAKSVAQVALRWNTQRGVVPVTGGDNPEHLMEDLDIFSFKLSDDEMSALAAIGRKT